MTDGNLNIADLIASGEEELVFDDDVFVIDAAPVAIVAPVPTPTSEKKPRRAPRRGRDSLEKGAEKAGVTADDRTAEQASESVAPSPPAPPPAKASAAAAPAPVETIPASAIATPAVAEEPAGSPVPVPQPDVGPAGFDRRSVMLLAIVILSLFTSLLSLGGLIAVGRTLAHAEADRARAEDERSALVRVPAIVKTLDDASARLAVIASRTPNGPPASVAEVQQAVDGLRLSIAQHQPDGLAPLSGITRDGLSDIGTRLDRLSSQISGLRAAPVPSRPLSPVGQ